MKIEVTIDDEWVEDGEIKEAIRSEIIYQTVDKVKKHFADEFRLQIKEEAIRIVKEQFSSDMLSLSMEVIKEATIDKKPVREFMISQFEKGHGWNSPKDAIKKEAENIANEMKKRYDMQFAALLIDKLNKGGFLKEGVADLLLTNEQPK